MVRECSTHVVEDFGGKSRMKETIEEDLEVRERIILKWLLHRMKLCGLHSSGSG
jgi:hypothetical protein